MTLTPKDAPLSAGQKFLKRRLLRFFLSAGIAAIADFVMYFIMINFVLEKSTINVFGRIFKAHEFAFYISYSFGVLVNFTLTKFTVFNNSTLKSRQQFSRFVLIAFIGFYANYGLLKLFVELFGFIPTFSRILAALSLAFVSYYVHKLFTFSVNKDD